MKKSLLLCLLIVLTIPSFAANIDLSGRAGVFTIPGGEGTSAMYGLSATYALNPDFSVRGAIETTSYTVNSETVTYTPVTLDLIYQKEINGMFFPYLGAGLSYNSVSTGSSSTQTAGAQAEAGIKYNFGGFSAGIEYRYLIPDLNESGNGSSTYNAYATSSFDQSFSF